jgi:hypothetical protein
MKKKHPSYDYTSEFLRCHRKKEKKITPYVEERDKDDGPYSDKDTRKNYEITDSGTACF